MALAGLLFLTAGCSSQDAEGLTRVCQKAMEKSDKLTGGKNSKLSSAWQALRGPGGGGSLDGRVATRLRYDSSLANADIRVSIASPGVVKLEGTVANTAQRGRALELAKSTEGVTDALDAMDIK
jgi:osmotically-inducible protein OsmY